MPAFFVPGNFFKSANINKAKLYIMSTEINQPVNINKTYGDWDCMIIQLHDEASNTGKANIKMMRQDMEAMATSHGVNRGEIIEMLVQALEEQVANKENEKENAEL